MNVGRLDRENLSDDIRRSLDDLMVDQVDIYWLHRDDVSRPVGEILETLNYAGQRELAALEERVRKLEERLDAMTKE